MVVLKKTISLILAIVLIASIGLPVSARRELPTLLLNEPFSTYATNETPPVMDGNTAGRVVWRNSSKSDKQLVMEGNGEIFSLNYPLSEPAENLMFEFSISAPEGSMGTITFVENTTRRFAPISISESGAFRTTEGKNIALRPTGSHVELGINFDVKKKQFSVFSGGKCVLKNWYSSTMNMSAVTAITIELSTPEEGNSSIYLDDIRAYTGNRVTDYSSFPKPPLNTEELAYIPPSEEVVGQTVFANIDFEDERNPYGTLVQTPKDNISEIRYDKALETNYAYMKKTNTEDVFMDLPIMNPARYMVFQSDIKIDTSDLNMTVFAFRESVNGAQFNVIIAPGGSIRTHENKNIGQLTLGKWHNIAMIADFNRKTYDFYVDGEQTGSKEPFAVKAMAPLETIRTYIYSGAGDTDLAIDNFMVYEGRELIDINNLPKPEPKSVYPSDDNIIKALSGYTALNVNSGTMFYDGKKVFEACYSEVKDDEVFVSAQQIGTAFGLATSTEGEMVKIGDSISVSEGNSSMGSAGSFTQPPYKSGEHLMIQLKPLVEQALGLRYFSDPTGRNNLVVMGPMPFTNTGAVEEISDYLMYMRPSRTWLAETLEERLPEVSRPRVMISQSDLSRIKDQIDNNVTLVARGYEQMVLRCNGLMDQPPREYSVPDGLRLLESSRTVLRRVQELGLVYLMTKDAKYAERAWVEIENAANYKDWNAYVHFLDAAEMAMAFAIGYDWLYDYWSDEQKQIMRDSIIEFSLIPAYNYHFMIPVIGGTSWNNFWLKDQYNWNGVCNGGTSVAVLAIMDDLTDEEQLDIALSVLHSATRSLEYMMVSFFPDGAWEEGSGYWGYTLNYLCRMLSTYYNVFGTDMSFSKADGFDTTAEFILHMEGYTGTNNFHDAGGGRFNAEQMFWLAQKVKKPDIGALRLNFMKMYDISPGLFDILWYDTVYETVEASLPLDSAFGQMEFMSFRSSWTDTSKMYISTQGGQTNVNHYHVDGGAFVLDSMGVRWAVDLGPEDYNHPAPTNDKYRLRAEGHNTIVINPDSSAGQELEAFGPIEKFETKSRGGYGILDMTDYYRTSATSVRRGFKLDDDRKSAVVRDEITVKAPSDIYWFLTTREEIIIEDDHIILQNSPNKYMRIDYLSNVPLEIGEMDAVPLPSSPNPEGQNPNSGYRKIFIKARVTNNYQLTVKFTPSDEMDFCSPIDDTRLDDWSIQDGILRAAPELENVQVNGTDLRSFVKTTTYYTVNIPADFDGIPDITATPADGVGINIVKAQNENERTKIETYYLDEPSVKGAYYFEFNKLKKLDAVNGKERIPAISIAASEVPQPENPPSGAMDGSLDTRWSAEGIGQWLELEFEQPEEIGAIAVAFYFGDQRSTMYDLEVSSDGIHYEQVYSGQSDGKSNDFVIHDLDGVTAQFVRLVGRGNTSNGWTSVTEFGALRK